MPPIFVSITKGARNPPREPENRQFHSFTFAEVAMRIGIEVFVVTDSVTNKKGLRIYPYVEATEKQKTILAAGVAIILFAGSLLFLSCQTPDPIIQPTVHLFP